MTSTRAGHWWSALPIIATVLLCTGCFVRVQRIPGPMRNQKDPLPPGTLDMFDEGPEEVLVLRHADPIQVRPANSASSFPLKFFRKQARVNSGSWVFCGAGGRAEIIWPNGTSLLLFGRGSGVIGSKSREEPSFFFQELTRASVTLTAGDHLQLLGGALLYADSGPFVLENDRVEIVRVRNRSKATGRVVFRDGVFDLDAGQVIDLPLLESGGQPIQVDPSFQTLETGGAPISVRGDVEILPDPDGTRVRAGGEHEIRAYGVRVRLDVGEEALFRDLSPRGAAAAADEPLFSSVALDRAYVQMAGNEGSCGEGKCGDDKGGDHRQQDRQTQRNVGDPAGERAQRGNRSDREVGKAQDGENGGKADRGQRQQTAIQHAVDQQLRDQFHPSGPLSSGQGDGGRRKPPAKSGGSRRSGSRPPARPGSA